MAANKRLLVLPGDGVGPEVMRETRRVIDWMDRRRHVTFSLTEDLVGGAAIDHHGVPITEETLEAAKAADAVLFGAVGGPRWDKLGFDVRPEIAILRLRKELGLFANLRPATVLAPLVDASTLKPDVVRGLDLMIVRESTGGIYFGEPRGVETLPDGQQRGVDTEVYTTHEVERVARVAFGLARKRQNRVTSVEKANVMASGLMWRQIVTALHQREFPDVELSHMYADNCAMQLVRNPRQFDVIVTSNLFGDLLSDLASMLTGSLGMLPSATLGALDASGRRHALYEPIHGSAPDIAGKGLANPMAQILSFAMLLRYSFEMEDEAKLIEQACTNVLASGLRTADVMGPGTAKVGTSVMGESVVRELDKLRGLTTLYIDADACPVREEAYRVATRLELQAVVVSNGSRPIRPPGLPNVRMVVVGDKPDEADDWIAERIGPGDVCVTADIPLASRCLARGARALSHSGHVWTGDNIGSALAGREVARHLREIGAGGGGQAPMTKADRSRFLSALDTLARAALRDPIPPPSA